MDIKLNKTLNPKLWDKDILKEEVLTKLKTIAQAFIGFLEIPNDAVKDIRLLGSSANYNYTKHSDIDLHIVVDYEKVHKTCPVVAGYLFAQKSLFNKEHDITIYGIPVELYAESHKDKTASNGIYSIKENKWISKPSKPKLDVDDLAIKSKYEELERAINDTNSQEEAQQILDKIYQFRKAGLDKVGEFSVENIVFKKLRDNELIQKLKGQIKNSFDKKMSLKECIEDEAYIIKLAQEIFAEYLTR